MWDFLKGNKGKKFYHGERPLWYSIDKNIDEIKLSSKVSRARKLVKDHLMTNGVTEDTLPQFMDSDFDRGLVLYRATPADRWTRVYEKLRDEEVPSVGPAVVPFGFRAAEHLDDINK